MTLRPLEPEDLDLLYTIENSLELWDSTDNDTLLSRYAIKQYIARMASIYECNILRLAIVAGPEDTPALSAERTVGVIDLTDFSARHRRAEVGLALLAECRGMGLGSKALLLMEELAVSQFHIHTLTAHVATDNTGCLKVFERAGFSRIGTLADWICRGNKHADVVLLQKVYGDFSPRMHKK